MSELLLHLQFHSPKSPDKSKQIPPRHPWVLLLLTLD
ncbi:hypothetical protein SLEP1_g54143 [Rubroshorea leprosula]|uniref:Uncharacterized protein n=1 Tax=Rubroshorea leprosula TaxID=152421 RepID=A0AAV5MBH6_9ROSI|nr:hypothetical protein SLEP1_g54143 [Rubroshorea leprosula]